MKKRKIPSAFKVYTLFFLLITYPTGRSERYGRKLLNVIKSHFGKKSHQFITAEEFAEYTGIKEDVVNQYLETTS